MALPRKTRSKTPRTATPRGSVPASPDATKPLPAATKPLPAGRLPAPAAKPRRGSLPLLIASGIGLLVWLIFLVLTAYATSTLQSM